MAETPETLLNEGKAQVSIRSGRLGSDAFEIADVVGVDSMAASFAPSNVYRIALLVIGGLMLVSGAVAIVNGALATGAISAVLALPMFWLASRKDTHVLAVALGDGRRIEYNGASAHVKRVKAAIELAKSKGPTGSEA